GGAEAGDLLHAIDRVGLVTADGRTLAEAARLLEADLEGTDVESIPLEPGRQDVVRIMNLHKAKGLEAPVVFLADPTGGVGRWVDVRVVREATRAGGYLRITLAWGTWGRDLLAEPEHWDRHAATELAYLEAEETRLLYVAATRARDLLVISRYAGSTRATRPWERFAPWLAGVSELPAPGEPGLAAPAL